MLHTDPLLNIVLIKLVKLLLNIVHHRRIFQQCSVSFHDLWMRYFLTAAQSLCCTVFSSGLDRYLAKYGTCVLPFFWDFLLRAEVVKNPLLNITLW